jgi:hypothetical protein
MTRLLLLTLVGCGKSPYEVYWPDEAAYPTVSAVSPESADTLLAGGTLTITGTKLDTTRTVIVGGRNATVVSASAGEVVVERPIGPAGGGEVDVVVVTDDGFARAEGAFTWAVPGAAAFGEEAASIAIRRVDGPVQEYCFDSASAGGIDTYWCAIDLTYVDAVGFDGPVGQPGLAAELAQLGRLADLPPQGEVALLGPQDVAAGAPRIYGSIAPGAAYGVTTPRDLAADADVLEDLQAEVLDLYAYADAVTGFEAEVDLYDADGCWVDTLAADRPAGDTMDVDGDARGVAGYALNLVALEEYDVEVYRNAVTVAAGTADGADGALTPGPSGVVVAYDDWTGEFLLAAPPGFVGRADLPPGSAYDVWRRLDGVREDLGSLNRVPLLADVTPDPRAGLTLDRGADLSVSWANDGGEDDAPVVVEIALYAPSLPDPDGWPVARRLVSWAPARDGGLTIPAEALAELPAAPGAVDDNGDPAGLHAYLTVTRHGVHAVPLPEGGALIVDVVHQVEGAVVIP